MANESSNSRPSVNSKTPSRGSTPNQQATRAPLSQQRKVQHVPSQPPATNAWSSAARTANSVMGTAKAQPPPVAAASQAGNKANTAVQASGGNATVRDHAPANDFNAKEVREFMKKGHEKAVADDPERKSAYRPEASGVTKKRASGAWGTKPSHMANGQEFWQQLAKQVGQLEQGRGG